MYDNEQKSMQTGEVVQSTIVITGMHRSGTSLTSALCQNAGVDVGKRLMKAHESNPKGFYENLDFVDFHRKVLQSQGINEAGYTLQEKIDIEEHYRDEAKKIISENSQSQLWGWKDPRTTLFLDFWVDLLPNACFLLIYRSPWEVIDSLYRRGTDRLILSHPDLAVKIWSNYNLKILEFSDRFPERCLLTNIYQITENTKLFIDTINKKFNINLSVPSLEIYDFSLLHKKIANVSGVTLVNHYCPEAIEIYRKLELKTNRIDETGRESWEKEINSSLSRVNAFQNWLAVRNLEKENKRIKPQLEQTSAQLEQIKSERQQTKTQLEQTSAQLEQVESERQQTKTQLEQTSAQLEQVESERQQTKTQLEQTSAQLEQVESERQQTKTQLEQTLVQLEQVESERQQTKTQLEQNSAQLNKAKLECQQTQKQLEQIQKEHFQSLEKLNNLIEQFNCLVTSMVESNRWKLGNLFYSVYRKILFKPLEPSPKEHQKKLINKFQTSNLNFSNAYSNSDKYPSPENLAYVIEEFGRLVTSMVESNRWKLGNLLYTVYRKILLQSLDPLPQEHQKKLLNKFQISNRKIRNANNNSEKHRNIEILIDVIKQYDSLVTSMVNSNRWKLGNLFYSIYKKILNKPIEPPPQEHQKYLIEKIKVLKPSQRSQTTKNNSKKNTSNFSQIGNSPIKLPNLTFPISTEKDNKVSKKNFRILLCSHNLSWQGAQNSLFELAMGYKNNCLLEPVVFSPADGPLRQLYESHDIPVFVHKFPTKGCMLAGKFDEHLDGLCQKIQEHKIDALHVNTLQGFYAILAANKLSIPCIWNIRESEKPETYFNYLPSYLRKSAYSCFNYASKVVFVADATRRIWEPYNDQDNFVCIHNAINEMRFWVHALDWGREEARVALGIKTNEKVLLSIGTVSERKGQKDLVEAYRLLSDDFASNFKVFIVGGNHSKYSQQLQNEINKLPPDKISRIKIVPETKKVNGARDIVEFYKAADAFIFCSRVESYPRVILEAMNFGLPIITTPVFGVIEQVLEGKNCFYYPADNPSILSDKIQQLFSDESLVKNFGTASKIRFREINSHSKMLGDYQNLLIESLNN